MKRRTFMPFVGAVALPLSQVAHAATSQQAGLANGTVVSLNATPHLWIVDEEGILHWGGDTRALAGRHVEWGNRVQVSLDQLKMMVRRDPWLSAGLLKDGDPIYLVKWETDWSVPKLQHIQSINDVELFGINAANYGNFVIDRQEWERRYGMSAGGLQREPLAAADTTFTAVNQPMRIRSASSDGSWLRAEIAKIDFTLTRVERVGPNSLLWHFSLWNHRDSSISWDRLYGDDHAYIVSSDGNRYVGLGWGPVRVFSGERQAFAIAFQAPTAPGVTYRLFLRSGGLGNIINWEPVTVTLR